MLFKQLSLTNFKIYNAAHLDFEQEIVCFTGPNGAGKTNLLDALHYLCIGKSYFNAIDSQNINHDANFFRIAGKILYKDHLDEVVCVLEKGKKKILKRNKVVYEKLSDHIGIYPVVMIAPDDLILINGGSEERRKFVDYILSFTNREYLEKLMLYNRLLSQRNALLKQFSERHFFDKPLLKTYDQHLIPPAEYISARRKDFIIEFKEHFDKNYADITSDQEEPGIKYKTDLKEKSMAELLEQHREQDRILQRTTAGIHKDDLKFILNDHQVKKYGSQGQKKSFLIALKLAQYEMLGKYTPVKPLLLLDDLFDKLDLQRAGQLLKMAGCGKFGQVFITDTQQERLISSFEEMEKPFQLFEVKEGKISPSHAAQ